MAQISCPLDLCLIVGGPRCLGSGRFERAPPYFLSLSVSEIWHLKPLGACGALLPGEIYPRPSGLEIGVRPVLTKPPLEGKGKKPIVPKNIGLPGFKGGEGRRKTADGVRSACANNQNVHVWPGTALPRWLTIFLLRC